MTNASDRDPVQLLAARDPAPADDVATRFGPDERAVLLKLAIARGRESEGHSGRRTTSLPGGSRVLRLASTSLVVGLVLTLVFALGGSGDDATPGPGYAAAAIRVAEVNPRILVTADGWRISHVEPLTPDSGETQFSDGTSELDITWYPARFYDHYRRDRANEPGPDVPIQVLGVTGTMIRYGESTDFATMLPPQGNVFVEIRGDLGSESAYREILASLETTDVDGWLAAMPASVVQPDEQGALVDSLLKGVPLPPGLDLDRLRDQAVLNPDGLRFEVADSVACGWLDSWSAADASGDEATKAAAVDAMATAGRWPVLQERPVSGSQSEAILSYARQISHDHLDRSFGGVVMTTAAGKSYEYGPAYAVLLGCDSMVRRPVEAP